MSIRELFGLALIFAGLVLTPVAWTTSRTLWLLSFLLFAVGGALFMTDRILRRMAKSDRESGGRSGPAGQPMPTDIHNYTGWRSGGRSDSMDGPSGGSDGGGD
jgi:hypothetical protein